MRDPPLADSDVQSPMSFQPTGTSAGFAWQPESPEAGGERRPTMLGLRPENSNRYFRKGTPIKQYFAAVSAFSRGWRGERQTLPVKGGSSL
jgi:hypothetical protein